MAKRSSTAARAPKPRVYKSALREEQTRRTRETILEALVAHLAEEGWETFSVARAAEKAGIAEPTVYRHFPNRESMVVALDAWLGERLKPPAYPSTINELPAVAQGLYDHFTRNSDMTRAALRVGVAHDVRAVGRKERDRKWMTSFPEAFDHLPPAEASALKALLRVLLSAESWDTMTSRLGASPRASSAAVGWALAALLDALKRDRELGRHHLVVTENPEATGATRATKTNNR